MGSWGRALSLRSVAEAGGRGAGREHGLGGAGGRGPGRAARPSRGARGPGRQLGLGAGGGVLAPDWKGSSAASGPRTTDPAQGRAPLSCVPPRSTLSPGSAGRAGLWAAGRPEPLRPCGWTEASAGGRGLPSLACLETKQTLLSCPPAPGILLRTRPMRSVTRGRSGEEIELSKGRRGGGEGGPDAEDGGASTAERPLGEDGARPLRVPVDIGGRRLLWSLVPWGQVCLLPVPGTKHPLFSWGGLSIWNTLPARWSRRKCEVSRSARQVDERLLEADGAPEKGGGPGPAAASCLSFLVCVIGLPGLSPGQGWEPGHPTGHRVLAPCSG